MSYQLGALCLKSEGKPKQGGLVWYRGSIQKASHDVIVLVKYAFT